MMRIMGSANVSRRSFYGIAIQGLGALITAALAVPAAVYLFIAPRSKKKLGQFVEAASIDQLQAQRPEEVVFRRTRVDGWRVVTEKTTAWVVKKDDQNVVAFAPQCTHLGCAYHWDDQKKNFICPCHTSAFSIDGKVLSGPAPRALDTFEARVDNGKLLLGSIRRS
jgi:menaquinol-cytochrome c reductase iron-sulfur subunit